MFSVINKLICIFIWRARGGGRGGEGGCIFIYSCSAKLISKEIHRAEHNILLIYINVLVTPLKSCYTVIWLSYMDGMLIVGHFTVKIQRPFVKYLLYLKIEHSHVPVKFKRNSLMLKIMNSYVSQLGNCGLIVKG